MPSGNFSGFKLGRKPKVSDPRTLRLSDYQALLAPASSLPLRPSGVGWTEAMTNIGPMDNMTIGCCVEAAAGHLIQSWTANTGSQIIVPDQAIIAWYSQLTGYIPGDESTDKGTDMLTALKAWRNTGLDGHKLAAFASIDPTKSSELQYAIYLLGGAYIGINVPNYAMQTSVWDYTPGQSYNIVGGHCVPLLDYSAGGWFWAVTWGQVIPVSLSFLKQFCDEAYGCVSADFLNQAGNTPVGFDVAQMEADANALSA